MFSPTKASMLLQEVPEANRNLVKNRLAMMARVKEAFCKRRGAEVSRMCRNKSD